MENETKFRVEVVEPPPRTGFVALVPVLPNHAALFRDTLKRREKTRVTIVSGGTTAKGPSDLIRFQSGDGDLLRSGRATLEDIARIAYEIDRLTRDSR